MTESEKDINLVSLIDQLSKSSEAGYALVSAAVADEWLQTLLLTHMRVLSNTVAERIFDSYGPLYELAPKADIAYALDLIDDQTLAALRVIKDIRNRFAHTREPLNFSSAEIDKLCRKLPDWKAGTDNKAVFHRAYFECVKKIDRRTQEILFAQVTSGT